VAASADRLAVGVVGTVRPIFGPSLPFEITAYDEASRCWAWSVGWSSTKLHLVHDVRRDAAGSKTTLRVQGWAVLVIPYLPLAQRALGRLVSQVG
jgi:hypothetical protein